MAELKLKSNMFVIQMRSKTLNGSNMNEKIYANETPFLNETSQNAKF